MSETSITRLDDGWIVKKKDKTSKKYIELEDIKDNYLEISKEIEEEDPPLILRLVLKIRLTDKSPEKDSNKLENLKKDISRRSHQEEKYRFQLLHYQSQIKLKLNQGLKITHNKSQRNSWRSTTIKR